MILLNSVMAKAIFPTAVEVNDNEVSIYSENKTSLNLFRKKDIFESLTIHLLDKLLIIWQNSARTR